MLDPTMLAWWAWPLLLFAVTFLLGIVAVIGGIGGGVLFVPIVAGFLPFHLDFVRGAGLLLALSGALSAGPSLLRGGLASLRLAMPLALAGSIGAIAGAFLGLAMPTRVLQLSLGIVVLAYSGITFKTPGKPVEFLGMHFETTDSHFIPPAGHKL